MGNALKGKGAVVTGAGGGLGKEVALALAAEGAGVVVVDPGVGRGGEGGSAAPADVTVAEIKKKGGNAVASYDSVADYKGAENMVQACVKNFGSCHITVCCAGVLREKMVFNMPPEDWDVVLKVHVYGTFNVVRHAAPIFRDQRFGRIVTFTSVAWLGTMGQSNYGTAKGGIVSFTKAMARELGRYGVTANAIAPQASTRMTMDQGVIEGMKKRLAAGVITKEAYEGFLAMKGPEYIPPIITYLCTDDPTASIFNGQVFGAYGGKISIFSDPIEARAIYKEGLWTLDELKSIVPTSLATGVVNIAPPEKK